MLGTIITNSDLTSPNCFWGEDKLHVSGLDRNNQNDYYNVRINLLSVDLEDEGEWFLKINKDNDTVQTYWIVHIRPPGIFENKHTPLPPLPFNKGQDKEFVHHDSRHN